MQFILVGCGGFLGAIARYSMGRLVTLIWPNASGFPVATLLVNVFGSFLIGVMFSLATEKSLIGDDTRLLVVTGFLGAFTTFSAFSLETLQLLEAGQTARALVNIGGNLVFCLLFVWLGVQLVRVASL